MPKCSHVVALIVGTNILTLTIYSSIKNDYNNLFFKVPTTTWTQPQPQPLQYSRIQTGRVIQSINEDAPDLTLDRNPNPSQVKNSNHPGNPVKSVVKNNVNFLDNNQNSNNDPGNPMKSSKTETKTKNSNDLKNLFTKRKQNIDKVCAYKKSHPTEPFINDPTHLLVLQDRNVAWCPVFKAGSSTWLTIILDLSSVSESRKKWIQVRNKNAPLQMGRAVAPSLTRSSWIRWKSNLVRNNVNETSFIVVRHPFERLVSAYRDKLERTHAKNYLTDWYFKQYGQKIVKKYRSKAISIFGNDFFSFKNNYGAPLPVKDNKRTTGNLPTFWEFVQFVIDSKKSAMDEHWKPTSYYCSMCMLNYDYVIKFEDLSIESQAFLEVTKLKQYVSNEVWERHVNTNRPDEMSSAEVTAKYFGQLSDEDIYNIYTVYEDDFKLFDYHFKFRNISLPT